MKSFVRDRGPSLGMVVLIMIVISVMQGGISLTMTLGALQGILPADQSLLLGILLVLRWGFLPILAVLWILKQKLALFRVTIFANTMFTLTLLLQMANLVKVLFGVTTAAIDALLLDVLLMAVANILIFSVWYWIIDPPGVEDIPRDDKPWELLFPQRGGSLPHYESWVPRYADYLFVAFTTSFAFSPTDTMPLTRRAKLLMMLQAAISVITLTGIAASAINILAGGK